jgi:hypothetical protein
LATPQWLQRLNCSRASLTPKPAQKETDFLGIIISWSLRRTPILSAGMMLKINRWSVKGHAA